MVNVTPYTFAVNEPVPIDSTIIPFAMNCPPSLILSDERRKRGMVVVATGGVVVARTLTVVVAVDVPAPFIAESVYVVVVSGFTVIDVLAVAPIPLSSEVELAFATLHESTALWPAVIVAGVAVKVLITGSGCAIVAEQLVVATVEDASVAVSPKVCVPGR